MNTTGAALQFQLKMGLTPFGNTVSAGSDSGVFELSKLVWVSFTVEDGTNDGKSRNTTDVADDIGELDIHLRQSFLHVLNTTTGGFDEIISLTPVGSKDTDLATRTEGILEQSESFELLQPLSRTQFSWTQNKR